MSFLFGLPRVFYIHHISGLVGTLFTCQLSFFLLFLLSLWPSTPSCLHHRVIFGHFVDFGHFLGFVSTPCPCVSMASFLCFFFHSGLANHCDLFYPLVVIIPTFGDLQGVWFIHISMTGRCSCPFVSSVSPPSFFFHFGLASHCALLSIPMGSSFLLLVPHGLFGLFYISRIGLRSCPCVSLVSIFSFLQLWPGKPV